MKNLMVPFLIFLFCLGCCGGDDDSGSSPGQASDDDDDDNDDHEDDDDDHDDDDNDDNDDNNDDSTPPDLIDAGDRFFFADDQGRAIVFHGSNITEDMSSHGDPEFWAEEEDFEIMSQWGFNLVRLPYFWHSFEQERGVYTEGYLDRVEQVLDWCYAHGLLAIIDFHQDRFSHQFEGRGFPDWATRSNGFTYEELFDISYLNLLHPAVMSAYHHLYNDEDLQQAQVDAWMEFVRRLKDHPALLGYDLMNEPWLDWQLIPWTVEETSLTAMYQRLIDAIRAEDTEKWIFFEPWVGWCPIGVKSRIGQLQGERIAYYPHLYSPTQDMGDPYSGDARYFDFTVGAMQESGHQWGFPVMVGEWGVRTVEDNYDQFLIDALEAFDKKLAGWTVWHFRGHGGAYDLFDRDGNERTGKTDLLIRAYPQKIAGIPKEISYDPDTKTMELEFDDSEFSEGPTEIFIPETRHYPGGWTVEVSDPEGTWEIKWDDEKEILSIWIDSSFGEHTVSIRPAY